MTILKDLVLETAKEIGLSIDRFTDWTNRPEINVDEKALLLHYKGSIGEFTELLCALNRRLVEKIGIEEASKISVVSF